MYFPKRIPEPKQMGGLEMKAFEALSKENYKRWIIPFVDDVLNYKKINNGKIIDVGCGPGLLAKEFALRSSKFQVIGIDISNAAINMAKKNCRGIKNVVFDIGNVNKLAFVDNGFDVVVCKDSLHHFKNPRIAIREMLRITKPGGVIYIQDIKRDVPWYLLRRVVPPKNTIEKLIFYSTRAAYTKKEIEDFFNDLSISRYYIRTRKITNKMRHRYAKLGINMPKLREGFQSRLSIIIVK